MSSRPKLRVKTGFRRVREPVLLGYNSEKQLFWSSVIGH